MGSSGLRVQVSRTVTPTRRAYRFREFCKTYGIGKDAAYKAIRSGALVARKRGKATIILAEDAERYFASLPRLQLGVNNTPTLHRATPSVDE